MRREIKFRGRRKDDGTWVYGDFSSLSIAAIINKSGVYAVDPDSVKQFCGYDSNGDEIYEGDRLTDGDDIFIASIHEPPQIYLTMTLIKEAG